MSQQRFTANKCLFKAGHSRSLLPLPETHPLPSPFGAPGPEAVPEPAAPEEELKTRLMASKPCFQLFLPSFSTALPESCGCVRSRGQEHPAKSALKSQEETRWCLGHLSPSLLYLVPEVWAIQAAPSSKTLGLDGEMEARRARINSGESKDRRQLPSWLCQIFLPITCH